jgi:hypothetical protein
MMIERRMWRNDQVPTDVGRCEGEDGEDANANANADANADADADADEEEEASQVDDGSTQNAEDQPVSQ